MNDDCPPSQSHALKKAKSKIEQYAALNLLDRVRSGDMNAILKVLPSPPKVKPFQVNFDDIETTDDVWNAKNSIYKAALIGQINLPIAKFALARVEDIGDIISHNLEVKRERDRRQQALDDGRKVFAKKLKEYEALPLCSVQRVEYRSRNPIFAELLSEYEAERRQDEEHQ